MSLFEQTARGTGKFVFLPSDEEVPFPDFWDQSEQVSRWLTARVGRRTRVATVLTNTPNCVPNIFGVWRSDNTLVSLPHPSRGTTPDRYRVQIEKMLDLAEAEILLAADQYLPLIPELSVPVVPYSETLTGGPRCDTTGEGGLIQFTSGSVGTPKGVVLPPDSVAANIRSLLEVIQPVPGDTPCSWLPLSHDMGFIGMFLTPLSALAPGLAEGGIFPLMTPEYFLSQPSAWLQTCSDFGVTITTAPNFALELACRVKDWHTDLDLSPMRMMITGAERVSAPTLRRFTETFADTGLEENVLCPAYGLAEATLAVTLVRPKERWHSLTLDRQALGRGEVVESTSGDGIEYVSNGAVMPGMEVRISSTEGDLGEVQVRGPSLLSEYIGSELALTDDGWFPTRDVGFLKDGELYLAGRTDDTIIVGGRNYYAPDIEAAVRHESVRKGCLAAVPTDDGFILVAELTEAVPDSDHDTVCRQLMAASTRDCGIRPERVTIVPRGVLPKTPSGKLQRVKIAQQLDTGEIDIMTTVAFGG
jgi:acyl-CoA synthetase (AMP-forming)/AMP-acid ligase II